MEFSKWDETSCSLLCQHPCCWSSINRIERSVPRKSTSTVKLDAINYDSSRDNKEKTEGKRRKGDNVFDGDMIITGPTICDLLKSFPVCPEPLFPLGANSGTRQNKYGLYTDIDSQESLRFDVPRCPPGSEEKVPILSYEENIVPCVHIVQAFIINGDCNSLSRPQYVWIPAKKKETKENAFSGGQKPSTQIFEASQVLECKRKQRKENMTDVFHNWSTWVSSSKFRYKTHKYHHKPVDEAERQRTISSDLDLKFCTGNLYQEAPEHLVGKKWVKENLLKTRGLSADSRIFWKPTSIKGSATNKRCPFTLVVSQNTSQDDFLCNGNYNLQKWSKIEFKSKNNESVKIPASEASQGKLSTINLELGSKDECPITQPMNYQKKEINFSLVPVSPLTGNLPMDLKEAKDNLNKLSSEKEQKERKDVPGTICASKHENVLAAKEGRRQKKGRLENVAKCTFQTAPKISFIQTLDAFEPQNSCCIEAMPLHRVRINNTPTTQQRKQLVCSRKKTNCHISSKKHSAAAMTSHKRVMSSPPNELKVITTEKNELTEKVDFPDLPKPPPPSPQMLSNFNRGPSSHQLFDLNESECMFLLEKPKTISNLEPANDKLMTSKGMHQL